MELVTPIINKDITGHGPNVVSRVEDTIKLLGKENILNCAIILSHKDGSISSCYANNQGIYQMIGALEVLKQRFINEEIEALEDTDLQQ